MYLFSGSQDISSIKNPWDKPAFGMISEIAFVLGKAYIDKGLNLVVLNLADAFTPGGGFKEGKGAQKNLFSKIPITMRL